MGKHGKTSKKSEATPDGTRHILMYVLPEGGEPECVWIFTENLLNSNKFEDESDEFDESDLWVLSDLSNFSFFEFVLFPIKPRREISFESIDPFS